MSPHGTETKRQGTDGQTSCTSVHKANLGSQLSIFDTGSSARARPRRNDPPERVHAGALKRPARTTETKRQGRAGQTGCTSVHKANLGSQLSIFDTGSSARARPRPNDPPERVHAGALKRPARTTETKRQGRAGQTSCTSVHKANLGSQLSIFDTGSSARARPRPNDPPERVHAGAIKRPPERPKRSDKGEPGKRAARACTKPTSGHNLAFLIRARPPGRALARTTRPNEFTRAPSNDPPERPKRSDKGEPGKRAARACTKPTSGHNLAFLIRARPPGRALARTTRPNEFTRAPSNDPPERPKRSDKGEPGKRAARACTKPTSGHSGHNLAFLIRARPPGRALARTTRPNEFTGAPSNDPPERPKRSDKGEPGKRAARACTKPTSGHNLAFLIRARPPGRALARTTRPNEFTRAPSNDPPERPKRSDKGEPGKRAARACTKPTSGHNLAFLIRARPPGRALARTTRPNEFTGAPSNDPPERPKRSDKGEPGKRAARACTKPTSGHNLAFLIRARPPGRALARTTRPNEFTRAPSNDPPERPKRSDKGEPGKRAARACTKPTSGHNLAFLIRARPPGRALARTTRPNEFTRAPSNDPPERPKRSDKGEPGKRAARACTKPTSGHNLAFLIRARPPGRALARTTRPNEFTRAPSNDPPERPKRSDKGEPGKRAARACTKPTSGHNLAFLIRARPPGRALARTTRPNEFTRAPSNDPPERPKRKDKGEPGKRAARACTKPTSGHNLAFLIRARPPGRALARTTRPNEFTRAPSNDPPERPKRSDKGEPGKRAARACTKPTSGHNLAFLIRARPPGRALARTTRPNEFTRAPSNDPPERPKRSDKGEPGKRAARACTKPTSGHNLAFLIRARPPGRALARTTRPNEFTRAPSNDPPERPKRSDKGEPGKRAARACTKPTSGHNLAFLIRARPPGRALARTTRPNEFTRAPSNDPPERPKRSDKGEPGKRAARACTKPTSGHNLAFLIRARPPGRALARTTRPNEFTRAPSNDPPERPKRSDKGEPGKRAARACTKPTSGHNLAFLIRARPPGRALARTTRPNEFTRAPSNDPPERPKRSDKGEPGKRAARACTKPTSGHNLAFLIRARPPGRALARTTRPNEFTRAPSNDPPERPKRKDKGEPGKRAARACTKPTSGHNLAFLIRARPPGRALARTTRPNEFTRAPSNDPPERPKRSDKGEPGKRAARACTKPTSGHNLAFLIRARSPGRALARNGRPQTTRPNDPPERPARTSSHERPQTTRPNELTQAPSNDPPERPAPTSSHGRPQTTRPNDPPERVHTGALKRPTRTTRPNEFTRAPSNDPPERPTRSNEFTRAPSNDPPERPKRTDKGELGKRAARTCTKPTSGHNLAFLIRPSPERVHPGALKRPARTTHPNEFTRAPSNDPPERPTRTTRPNEFTRAPSNDPPERPTRTTCPNEFTRVPSHDPPERPKRTDKGEPGKRAARTCTKPTSGHNLAFLIRPSPERVHPGALKRPARTTHPNEFTRAPSNDPPERPTRTTRPNEFTRAPSNDPPERPTRTTRPNDPPERPARTTHPNDPPKRVHTGALKRPARTTETNRQGRAGQKSCTNVHEANLGSQLSIFDTALARTSSPGRPQTTRLNDPPERPARTSSHGRPQTTRPNDPPERPARTSSHGCPQTTRPNDRNEPTRESRANELHERAQSQPRVTT
jgi:hypothetical protein